MSNDSHTHAAAPVGAPVLSEGLGPLVEVLAAWEDKNGTMAAILPSEWDALKQEVMDACVVQSPRMLRAQLSELRATTERLRAALAASCDEHRAEIYDTTTGGGCVLLFEAVAAERERCAAWLEAEGRHDMAYGIRRGMHCVDRGPNARLSGGP